MSSVGSTENRINGQAADVDPLSILRAKKNTMTAAELMAMVGPSARPKSQGSTTRQQHEAVQKPATKVSELPFIRVPRSFLPLMDVKAEDGFSYTPSVMLVLGYVYTFQSMNAICPGNRGIIACNLGLNLKRVSTAVSRLLSRGNLIADEGGNLRVDVASLGRALGVDGFRASNDFLRIPLWFTFWNESSQSDAFVYGDILSSSLMNLPRTTLATAAKAMSLHVSRMSVIRGRQLLVDNGLAKADNAESAMRKKATSYRAIEDGAGLALSLKVDEERRAKLAAMAKKNTAKTKNSR